MPGRALVTGRAGFTGRHMAEELSRAGYEVFGLEGEQPGQAVDLRDREALGSLVRSIQPEVVVHLAAVAFVAHEDVADLYTSNLLGTRNLLEALARCERRPERVLLASSANIYGNAAASGPIEEDCTPLPENDYAVSKYSMELLARCWRDQLPIIITRPFNYTGVGQSRSFLLPKLVDHFARGAREVELGNIDVFRDFSDVRMVVDAYRRLLAQGVPGEVYNVCSGRVYSIRQVLDMLAELAGYAIEVKVNPAFVRANEIRHLGGSNRRLVAAIGELADIPLPETLAWMYGAQTGA